MSSPLQGKACGERGRGEVGAGIYCISRAFRGPSHGAMITSLATLGSSPGCWEVSLTLTLTGVEEVLLEPSNSERWAREGQA